MSDQLVSGSVALVIAIGLVIAVAYTRAMWSALQEAVRTRDEAESEVADTYHHALIGAVISVVASSLAIAAYGLGPAFLYLGPVLALLSPIAVTYCLRQEVPK